MCQTHINRVMEGAWPFPAFFSLPRALSKHGISSLYCKRYSKFSSGYEGRTRTPYSHWSLREGGSFHCRGRAGIRGRRRDHRAAEEETCASEDGPLTFTRKRREGRQGKQPVQRGPALGGWHVWAHRLGERLLSGLSTQASLVLGQHPFSHPSTTFITTRLSKEHRQVPGGGKGKRTPPLNPEPHLNPPEWPNLSPNNCAMRQEGKNQFCLQKQDSVDVWQDSES